MSLNKSQELYENMLKKSENRGSSSGTMRQPTPFDDPGMSAEINSGKVDTSNIDTPEQNTEHDVSPEEQAYFSAIDQRMADRQKGKLPAKAGARASARVDESRIDKIEYQVKEMQDLLIEIMKAQMKLLNG